MGYLLVVFAISWLVVADASAQAASGTEGLGTLGGGRSITVVDNAGKETNGRLLRFRPDALVLLVKGQEVVFERESVKDVYQRGDSLKSGALIGLLVGSGLGIVGLATSGGDDYTQAGAAMMVLLGTGIGIAADAAITGRHRIHDRSRDADFGDLAAGASIIVVDGAGRQTSGRMQRLSRDSLTMTVNGGTRTIARDHVASVFGRDDSLKNGTLVGLSVGVALGLASGATAECGDFWEGPQPCASGEKLRIGLLSGALFGSLGAGLGAGIDALIPGRRSLFERSKHPAAPVVALIPALSPSAAGLVMSVKW